MALSYFFLVCVSFGDINVKFGAKAPCASTLTHSASLALPVRVTQYQPLHLSLISLSPKDTFPVEILSPKDRDRLQPAPTCASNVKSRVTPQLRISTARAAQDKCMCEAASDAAQSARAVFQAANFIWIYLYSNIVVRWPSRGKRKGKCSRWSGTPAPTVTV